jgi:N6-adenosine-specific RNA methylase IME4
MKPEAERRQRTAETKALFLWSTTPALVQAIEVMSAWGFAYKTSAVWPKHTAATGYWFRNRHELLLVGTKGSILAPAPGEQWESVIEAAAQRHSQKPDAVYELIEAYFPHVPKIELFARRPRPGWETWGNEIDA